MKKKLLFIVFLITTISLSAQVVAYPAPDLFACDIDNDGFEIFDLTVNEATIIGSQDPAQVYVMYHLSMADAENGTNAVFNSSSFMSAGQTIFAALRDMNNNYFDITTFELFLVSIPQPVSPTPLIMGEDDGDGFAIFDLTTKDIEISNGDPVVSIQYFESLLEAEAGIFGTEIQSPYQNIVPFFQTVYARVESQAFCFEIVSLDLVVQELPPIIPPIDLVAADGDGDGFAIFDLTVNEDIMLEGLNRSDYSVSYYELEADAENDVNRITEPTAYQNIENPQTIYVRVEVIDSGLYVLTSFIIEADALSVDTFGFEDLSIFPNPSFGDITIQSSQLLSETTISLYDILGKMILSKKVVPQNGSVALDISSFETGVYFLKISSEGNTAVRKLIKK